MILGRYKWAGRGAPFPYFTWVAGRGVQRRGVELALPASGGREARGNGEVTAVARQGSVLPVRLPSPGRGRGVLGVVGRTGQIPSRRQDGWSQRASVLCPCPSVGAFQEALI